MIDWREYWNSMPASYADDEVLRQVGWTVGGEPISACAVEAMIADIAAGLSLHAGDSLLDLCCGNGLLTSQCAVRCGKVTGVDFSAPLLRIARDRFRAPNVEYVLADVRALPASVTAQRFTKVLMYGAIQHLSTDDVERLLKALRRSQAGAAPIFLGAVPDGGRIWNFYDTEERRREYFRRVREGTEAIGHWWTTAEICEVGGRGGYRADIRPQSPVLPTMHYRFDALLAPFDG